MNVDTGEFRALSDQAARVEQYRRSETLLIRTLAAEMEGGDGPLSSDDVVWHLSGVVRRLSDALIEQGHLITDLRASLGIPANAAHGRHLRLVK